ncbi:hypothetical protein EDD41_2353 [Luteococcus japonicus]|uniref:Uncharacterized protein n=1 Tax=Luteococcus japonicus TaxID=33984 RepID=A0A3N1ZW72_9ACTN|nr:hypothetical protein [Luteococcus japonicus]ROR55100.1 hypothetical protein EDD41_2353 [Luteococcus japonicus]
MRGDNDRTWSGDGVELVGLRPFTVDNVYEFVLDNGSLVHLHDGDCTQVSYQPTEQTMTLTFDFDPQWSPQSHPAGCRVWLVFGGATLIQWEHEDGPSEYAGQCGDLGHHRPRVFSLELVNDRVFFTATRVTVFVEGPA